MARMKTFTKYLILFLLFYAFVSFMSYGFIRSALVPMESYSIEFEKPDITISEAKSSRVNGYVKGTIKNNTDENIKNKYVKVDFISKQNNVIISKYIEITDLEKGKIQDFDVKFNAENIKSFKMQLTDKKEISDAETNKTELTNILSGAFLVWLIFK